MKLKKSIALFLCMLFVFLCSSCSYVEFENKIHQKIDNNSIEPDIVESESKDFLDNVKILGTGDTMEASWNITVRETQETILCGTPGLTYTLNGIEIFDSICTSGIDIKETEWDDDNPNYEKTFADNAFILVDMTATYQAQNGENEVLTSIVFSAESDERKLGKSFSEIKNQTQKMQPYIIYFSKHPTDDDPRLSSKEGQYYCFSIKNGETLNFKLGIIAAQEFIDAKNVLLALGNVTADESVAVQNLDCRIFDLFK